MMFAALFNAVCLHNAFYFLPLTLANAICLGALSLGHRHIACLSRMRFCITYCAYNQSILLISFSQRFLNERAMCSLKK